MNPTRPLRIAFDIDDTLIVPSVATGLDRDTPNYENIAMFRYFQAQGNDMILWSGGGADYARMWGEKLGLVPFRTLTKEKGHGVDIAFDDCEVDLATVNVRVGRINNRVSRSEWNKNHEQVEEK